VFKWREEGERPTVSEALRKHAALEEIDDSGYSPLVEASLEERG